MAKHIIEGKYSHGKNNLEFILSLIEFNEDDNIIIYSPAIDLSGYGKSREEAQKSFENAMEEFYRYTMNKGTFETILKKLGWNIKGSKNKRKYIQPFLDKLLQEKEYLQEIVREKDFRKFQHQVNLSC